MSQTSSNLIQHSILRWADAILLDTPSRGFQGDTLAWFSPHPPAFSKHLIWGEHYAKTLHALSYLILITT